MQNHYNLIYREEEREMFPTLQVNLLLFEDLRFHLMDNSSLVSERSLGLLWRGVYSLAPWTVK